MNVYLDNAATTSVAPEVIQAMVPVLTEMFGNPSSSHAVGRRSRVIIEQSRTKRCGTYALPSEFHLFYIGRYGGG